MPAYIFECYSQATFDIESNNEREAWNKFQEENEAIGDPEWDNVTVECVELAEDSGRV